MVTVTQSQKPFLWITFIFPIIPIIVPGNSKVKKLSANLMDSGYGVFPVLSPTVTEGLERLRLIVHAFNTEEEIQQIVQLINSKLNG